MRDMYYISYENDIGHRFYVDAEGVLTTQVTNMKYFSLNESAWTWHRKYQNEIGTSFSITVSKTQRPI